MLDINPSDVRMQLFFKHLAHKLTLQQTGKLFIHVHGPQSMNCGNSDPLTLCSSYLIV